MIWLFVWILPVAVAFAAFIPAGIRRKRKDKYRDGVLIIACGGLALTLVGLTIFTAALTGDRISCRNTAANVGLQYRWSVSVGCYMEVDGRWLPRDQALHTIRILGLDPSPTLEEGK